jgi:hypothetical protein
MPNSVRETAITSSSAAIVWEVGDIFVTSTPETFTILYGRDMANLNIRSDGEIATASQTYSIALNSLVPGTVYFYRIESRNGFETVLTPDSYSFATSKYKRQ